MTSSLLKRSLTTISILFLAVAGTASAHTVTTATDVSVYHVHYDYCKTPTVCPMPDSAYEDWRDFSSQDRWYSGTAQWNCHGRTFDARQSWVPYADPYLDYDGPYCPYNPGYGDSIIWWNGASTSHSVTIVGSWNGLSTTVMSKYGMQGQYRHSLDNTVRVYGSNWAVTDFSAGTPIYTGLVYGPGIPTSSAVREEPGAAMKRLLEERKSMPWYEDVLKSEALYEVEHPRLVARTAQLTDEGKRQFLEATGDQARIAALLADLRDPVHYGILREYDHPSYCEDFITEIEAGKILTRLVRKRPELETMVIEGLTDLLTLKDAESVDPIRGAALHFLSEILNEEMRHLYKDEIGGALLKGQSEGLGFTEYYLSKM